MHVSSIKCVFSSIRVKRFAHKRVAHLPWLKVMPSSFSLCSLWCWAGCSARLIEVYEEKSDLSSVKLSLVSVTGLRSDWMKHEVHIGNVGPLESHRSSEQGRVQHQSSAYLPLIHAQTSNCEKNKVRAPHTEPCGTPQFEFRARGSEATEDSSETVLLFKLSSSSAMLNLPPNPLTSSKSLPWIKHCELKCCSL